MLPSYLDLLLEQGRCSRRQTDRQATKIKPFQEAILNPYNIKMNCILNRFIPIYVDGNLEILKIYVHA